MGQMLDMCKDKETQIYSFPSTTTLGSYDFDGAWYDMPDAISIDSLPSMNH
jgi:hypothetical protein